MINFEKARPLLRVLRHDNFRHYLIARLLFTFGLQMQSVMIGWQVYKFTHSKLHLGLIGLAEAIPFFAVALFAGDLADRFDRKKIILRAIIIYLSCMCLMAIMGFDFHYVFSTIGIWPVFFIIFITGIARGFLGPASSAFVSQLVPREEYVHSSTINSSVWDFAAVTGAATGGFLYGFTDSEFISYLTVFIICFLGFLLMLRVERQPVPVSNRPDEGLRKRLSTGIKFVFNSQYLLGALTLDMFAVLFGGVVAIIPAYTAEVLHMGPGMVGILKSAPSIGSMICVLFIPFFQITKNTGKKLLAVVALFGLATLFFALSRNIFLCFTFLFLTGFVDNISVVIRITVLQLFTPDEMRGRVSSVNSIFIGSSNEIGAFESGSMAELMGLLPSIYFGAAMTMIIVFLISKFMPKLRDLSLENAPGKKSKSPWFKFFRN